ncbi:hypothetical protein [Schleiferilactobacillus shenzhenensis]|uniref:Uncharacterized protein n=1 Tax=Schleiferilactobacillus shenzhenensis LY-73 TaxID=1231336 RepID=U4TL01_9LACO|nr:hypothetical protein [Schleiferilactobacillus shenzhenensis]ERL64070.1 hypothetical protein L248_1603 [Schleiferilactobacillus shenzhenensis LY-73]
MRRVIFNTVAITVGLVLFAINADDLLVQGYFQYNAYSPNIRVFILSGWIILCGLAASLLARRYPEFQPGRWRQKTAAADEGELGISRRAAAVTLKVLSWLVFFSMAAIDLTLSDLTGQPLWLLRTPSIILTGILIIAQLTDLGSWLYYDHISE